jgi:hypothetical protein
MTALMRIELFGVHEAHKFFGVTKQALYGWRKNDPLFPDPIAELASGPVWAREQLEEYRSARTGSVGRMNQAAVRAVLELNAKQYRYYEKQHRDKVGDGSLSQTKIADTIEKAEVNREMAEMNEAVLRGEFPEKLRG